MTKRNSVPIQCKGIGTRISELAEAVGDRKYAAKVAEVSTDSLQRYFREDTAPGFFPVALMAIKEGYNLNWVATGEGPKKLDYGETNSVDHGNVSDHSNSYAVKHTKTMEEVGDVMRSAREKYDNAVEAADYRPGKAVEEHIKSLIFSAELKCNVDFDNIISLLVALKEDSSAN